MGSLASRNSYESRPVMGRRRRSVEKSRGGLPHKELSAKSVLSRNVSRSACIKRAELRSYPDIVKKPDAFYKSPSFRAWNCPRIMQWRTKDLRRENPAVPHSLLALRKNTEL